MANVEKPTFKAFDDGGQKVIGCKRLITTIDSGGCRLAFHVWMPPSPAGVVVLYPGHGIHAQSPVSHITAELLRDEANMAVCMLDLPGHGESEGSAGFESADIIIAHAIKAARTAKAAFPDLPLSVVGNSQGGSLAVQACLHVPEIKTLALITPMIGGVLRPGKELPWKAFVPLWLLARSPLGSRPLLPPPGAAPPKPGVPPPTREQILAATYNDPKIIARVVHDKKIGFKLGEKYTPRTIETLRCLAASTHRQLHEIRCPFLVLTAGNDVVLPTHKAVCDELVERAATPPEQRRAVHYPDAKHVLLADAPPAVDQAKRELVEWLQQHGR